MRFKIHDIVRGENNEAYIVVGFGLDHGDFLIQVQRLSDRRGDFYMDRSFFKLDPFLTAVYAEKYLR